MSKEATLYQQVKKAQEMAQAGILYASASFLAAEISEITDVVNGCGSSNAMFDFVPDSIYGMYIGYCCFVHDWGYYEGHDILDKEESDRIFLNNMLRMIDNDCPWYAPKFLLRLRAKTYYNAVRYFGGPSFFKDKN